MTNVIEFNEFSCPAGMGGCEVACWLCHKPTLHRALFCAHCGSIQPVRSLDHFTRLGIDKRIDLDLDLLEKQYKSLCRTLDPQRFELRGMGERKHAAEQLAALEEAYTTLREPLARSRYWLALHQKKPAADGAAHPLVAELRAALTGAQTGMDCDKIAHRAGQAVEQGIVGLIQALRSQHWALASALLAEVEGLQSILGDVRSCRAALPSSGDEGPGGEGVRLRLM